MSETVTWEDPPERRHGTPGEGKAQRFVAVLRENPGKWAVYRKGAPHASAGEVLKRWGAQVATRRNGPNDWDIYARWPEVES